MESFNHLAGLGSLKSWLASNLPWIKSGGTLAPRAMVLVGLPGTGKNTVAKAIASALGTPLVTASADLGERSIHLHVKRNRELGGAAVESIKTLAFDLAAVVHSLEGNCDHRMVMFSARHKAEAHVLPAITAGGPWRVEFPRGPSSVELSRSLPEMQRPDGGFEASGQAALGKLLRRAAQLICGGCDGTGIAKHESGCIYCGGSGRVQ